MAQVTVLIVEGSPGTALVEAAETNRADLVVIATHRHGAWGRAILGSVADHVALRTTSAAVLTVQPQP